MACLGLTVHSTVSRPFERIAPSGIDHRVGVREVIFEGFEVYRGLSEAVLGSAFRPSQVLDSQSVSRLERPASFRGLSATIAGKRKFLTVMLTVKT